MRDPAVKPGIRHGAAGNPLRPLFDGELVGHGGRPLVVAAINPVESGPTLLEVEGIQDPGVQLEPVETLQRLDPAKPWAAWFGHQTGGQQPGHAVIPHPAMAATGRMRQGAEPEGFSDLRGPGHQDRWL